MNNVYITNTNCITPLGIEVNKNFQKILENTSGVQKHDRKDLLNIPVYTSILDDAILNVEFSKLSNLNYSRLEKMMILSLSKLNIKENIIKSDKTILIISTTKGNISQLDTKQKDLNKNVILSELAKNIAKFYGFIHTPILISNACVSGIMAVSVAKRLLQIGEYDNAIITSGDEVSKFVLSGFSSFQALSDERCQPYSVNRKGINLGEASASCFITTNKELISEGDFQIKGDSSINDANHISGPSRTGEGLFLSIQNALKEANFANKDIDFISAHGTATVYNDEMESIAFDRLNLSKTPMNSLKAYFGHTLGASGLLELIITMESIRNNTLIPSLGFDELGVSKPLNIVTQKRTEVMKTFLKTSSGFGGINTAVILEKI